MIASASDYDLVPLDKGDHRIDLKLNEFPLFVKKNHVVLLCAGGESSETLDDRKMTAVGRIDAETVYDYYRDDGFDPRPDLQQHLVRVSVNPETVCTSSSGVAFSKLLI